MYSFRPYMCPIFQNYLQVSAMKLLHYSSLPGMSSFVPVKLLLKGLLVNLYSVMPDNTSLLKAVGCKVYRSSKQRYHTLATFMRLLCVAADTVLSTKRRLIEYRNSLMKIKYFS